MKAGAPRRPCPSDRAMIAATPGPGIATASTYARLKTDNNNLHAANKSEAAQIEDDKKEIAALDHSNDALAAQLATLQRQVSKLVSAHAH